MGEIGEEAASALPIALPPLLRTSSWPGRNGASRSPSGRGALPPRTPPVAVAGSRAVAAAAPASAAPTATVVLQEVQEPLFETTITSATSACAAPL